MFCSQCGNAINLSDKFCGKCGTAALKPSLNAIPAAVISPQMPNFGGPHTKWWGGLPGIKPLAEPYGWLYQQNTLLVFDNHLALVRGAEKRSAFASAMTSGAFGLVGGVLGAARSVKDKIGNKFTNTDTERTQDLFNAGEFVWCKKTDAEIWEVQRKRFLGMKTPSLYALSCAFNSLSGILQFLFPLNDTQESFKSPIDNLGCKIIIKAKGLTEDEAPIAFKNLFKDLPRL